LRTDETNQSINRAAPRPNKTSQRHEYKIHINTVTLSLTVSKIISTKVGYFFIQWGRMIEKTTKICSLLLTNDLLTETKRFWAAQGTWERLGKVGYNSLNEMSLDFVQIHLAISSEWLFWFVLASWPVFLFLLISHRALATLLQIGQAIVEIQRRVVGNRK